MEIFINSLLTVATELQPAVGILQVIWVEYCKAGTNKAKLGDLLDRCKRVIGAIDQQLDKQPPLDIKKSIQGLVRHLRWIEQLMRNLVELGFMKSLLRRDVIAGQIVEAHQRLTDCLAIFQISAAIDLREYQENLNHAQIADKEALYAQLSILEDNDSEVLRKFDVVNNQLEAMMAIQQSLLSKVDKSPEERILQSGLTSLQTITGKKLPSRLPDWTITAYDVDIDATGKLGEGGFGVVRKGRWNNMIVAVKEMAPDTNPRMLLKEIKVWNRLHHPHVLPFLGASIAASPPFIVSQYMPNGDVRRYLTKNPNANRVQLVHEIALGMLYIHSKNIVHGDLKQVNILIDDAFKARISDFGLSEIKQYATTTLAVQSSRGPDMTHVSGVGTLRYMSPEAFQGVIDKGSDVYAFAMTVYEIFTNTPPFLLVPDGAIYHHIGEKHTRLTRPIDPTTLNRGLNDAMWSLIWNASQPLSAHRPDFSVICKTTERLADDRRDMLHQGMITGEEENSEDIIDLLGSEYRTPCSFSVMSDWGEVDIITPGAYFVIGPTTRMPKYMKVEDRRVLFHKTPTAPPYPTIAVDFVLVNDGNPVQVSMSHGSDGTTYGDGTCIFTVLGQEYVNMGVTDNSRNTLEFECPVNPQDREEGGAEEDLYL
ncbi:hypothetical protein FRB93_011929 [Tulasnella sp. JGI-2019a]|nr:hypothetical protein FRB93_011929 [Tulasnella sp. JGI-2019a]